MSEHLMLNFGDGREFEMRPDNATLYTFLGETALKGGIKFNNESANHVFLQTGEQDDETMTGTYVFSTAESYAPLANFMVEHDYPMVLNRREVPACDMEAYLRMVDQTASNAEIPDEIPDWLGGADESGK